MLSRAGGLWAAVCLLCLLPACAERSSSQHPLVGGKAPLFKATLLDDSPFDLQSQLGKNVIILDFWATWCGPCEKAMPVLMEVAEKYRAQGVEFYAVDLGETPATVQDFLVERGMQPTVIMDRDGAIAEQYQVEAIPQTVIIGRDGTVRVVHVGLLPNLKEELIRELDEIVPPQVARSYR
jgi:thiol-disulfide isomerase/thioredoxin